MERMKKHSLLLIMLMVCVLAVGFLTPVPVEAASFQKSKPKISKTSAYLNNAVFLKWSKVSGAKKYQIQRAKIKPSTGKTGKWNAWKTVKKTSVKAVTSGDYKYRVRAVNKKGKQSKWSTAKRIFAARAKIAGTTYTEPDIFFGVKLSEGKLTFRVLVNNKTKSPMGFVPHGTRFKYQNTIYALNKSTGKVMKKWDGDLITSGIAQEVKAGSKQTIDIYAYVTAEEYKMYKDCKFMITSSFYPNPYVEPLTTQMALAYTTNVKDSAIAAK